MDIKIQEYTEKANTDIWLASTIFMAGADIGGLRDHALSAIVCGASFLILRVFTDYVSQILKERKNNKKQKGEQK